MEADFHPLSPSEMKLLEKLLDHEFQGRDALRTQLASLTARQIDENGSLALKSGTNNRADVLGRCPTEGTCPDIDGVLIHVTLHVVKGKMDELEIFKEDGSKVQRPPEVEALVVY